MDKQISDVESVTFTDVLNLASWDRERSKDELLNFISRREAAVSSENVEIS